jgi:ABC-2 type transport system permease protein
MVEKELRSLLRTPRFRMVFIMGFTFGLMVWFPMVTGRRFEQSGGFGSRYFLAIVCVYAMTLMGQVTYFNCFGFDRSAAIFYFAAPASMRQTLIGKNIAALVFIYFEALVLTGLTAILGLSSAWQTIAETLAVVGVCSLYMLGLGNIASVHYPRGLTPERVSQGGASSRFQGLIFLLYPVALLPVALAYLARYAFDSEIAFLALLTLAAIGGGVFYTTAMESSVSTAKKRREDIVRELSKGEGPVATE